MYVDSLRLSASGEQALLNSNEGGLAIRPRSFKVGDYSGSNPSVVPETLLGNELSSGKLAYVEVLTQNSARFVFDVYASEPTLVGEILIQLESNIPLGHVVLRDQIEVSPLYAVRISLLLHTKYDVTSIVDVQMAEHSTIPSIASVEDLPHSDTVLVNAVTVLNMHMNTDQTASPGMAYKYGEGAYHWGFSEHDRVSSDEIGSNFVSENVFNTELPLGEEEHVIIQVVSGAGAGPTRIFKHDNGQLVNTGAPLPHVSASSTIAIWRRITNPTQVGVGLPWPEASDVPEDWVLTRGKEVPYWRPVASGTGAGGGARATLFHPPGRLTCRSLLTTAKPEKLTYAMPDELTDSNMILCGLSGTFQPRTAFNVRGSNFDLSESVDVPMPMDLRMFRAEPTQGHVLNVVLVQSRGDGQTAEFDIPEEVENADYVIAVVGRLWQPTSSYAVKSGKLAFTEPPESGREIFLYCLVHEERAGWTTTLRFAHYHTQFPQREFLLPTTPVSKDHVIVVENGLPVNPDSYNLVGDVLYTTSEIPQNRFIEILVFENLKSQGTKDTSIVGVVTDIVAGPRGIEVHRQGMRPLQVPFPELNIRAGEGIKVSGQYPNYQITNTKAALEAQDSRRVYSQHQRIEDSEEIVVVQRIEFNRAVLVSASVDFNAVLGPGFASTSGAEHIEYVLGLRGPAFDEPEYGRGVKGTAVAGFNVTAVGTGEAKAFANATINSVHELQRANHKVGYVEIVAKMRLIGTDVTAYGSQLGANITIKVEPL